MPPRLPDKRDWFYSLPHPERDVYVKLPAVTSILSVLAKPQLLYWAAKVTAQAIFEDPERYPTAEAAARVPFAVRDDAAARGKEVHQLIETWGRTGQLPGGHPYGPSFEGFLRVWRPDPVAVELTVFSTKHGYAGTTDMIADVGGELWVLDFKTSKSVYYEYHLQTAAYKHAEWAKFPDGRVGPKPEVQRTGVVLLRPDGTHEFVETSGDFELFLLLKAVFEKLKEKEVI